MSFGQSVSLPCHLDKSANSKMSRLWYRGASNSEVVERRHLLNAQEAVSGGGFLTSMLDHFEMKT